ncbi:hypothetical protein T03_6062 [Trichinella britovi]|uniref:Uncharacterized protein n=1 Tax=Trichinella britovi TaxID=45882 RepID=A0A0V1CSW6_TRIBR|nr:hypothetical protein T03_6062 [Trichinella britovi]
MESQLSGKKASVMLYTCHNCGGQLWKRRQSEMFEQKNFTIFFWSSEPEPNQRPMDTPSDQTSIQNDSTSSLTSQKRQVVTYDSERMALSYWMDRLQKLCARATNMEAIREATRALERTMQPFFDSRQLRLDADELLATAETPSSTETTQPPANNNKPNTTRSIPKLPMFDGDILQFKAFWDQFNAIVHRREDLEDVTKFVHFRSCLAGAALNAINGVETAAENYLAVVITNEVGKGKEGLLAMHNKLNGPLLELKAIGKNLDTAVSGFRMALPQLVSQLPKDIQSRWKDQRVGSWRKNRPRRPF